MKPFGCFADGRSSVLRPGFVWACVVVLVFRLSAAHATMIQVDSTADDTVINGNCTLREAVIAANTDAGVDGCPAGSNPDVIVVPAGTYLLTQVGAGEDLAATGDLDVIGDVEIQGAGALTTIVDGNLSDRVFDFGAGIAELSGVTIRNGAMVSEGGGIRCAGALTITDCTITSNSAAGIPEARGGGVRSSGSLVVTNAIISDNSVQVGSSPVPLLLAEGGGIYGSGPVTISGSTIRDNTVVVGNGLMFSSNSNGGGVFGSGGLLTITASTISGNVATGIGGGTTSCGGGGIGSFGPLTLTNSTISGNSAQDSGLMTVGVGGGVGLAFGLADATISNCTIANNVADFAGGVSVAGGASATFRNTIVANNAGNCDMGFGGIYVGDAYNLDSDDSCGFSGTDLVGVDPLLGPLQDNGGATFTHALLAGSPALERGNPAVPGSGGAACEAADQRGIARPQGPRCDIGSVEVAGAELCTAAPLPGCTAPGKSLLVIKDRDEDGAGAGDKLIWKWLKGPATPQSDFADPTTSANYTLCIYAGTVEVLAAPVPAGGNCGTAPCWKTLGAKGYKRNDPAASTSGVSKILLKGSDTASSKILLKGKGGNLDLTPTTLPLDDAATVVVQIRNGDNLKCWQSTFPPASVKKNTDALFKAKIP